MGETTIFDYARMAKQAEQHMLEIFEGSLRGDEADRQDDDLPDRAQSRQGEDSSG